MTWLIKILFYVLVAAMVCVSVLAAAFDNIFGIWTPLLNFLEKGWQSYAIVYAVFLVGVIIWDAVSGFTRKKEQDPS